METPRKDRRVIRTTDLDLGRWVPNKGSAWKVVEPPDNPELSRTEVTGQYPSFNRA